MVVFTIFDFTTLIQSLRRRFIISMAYIQAFSMHSREALLEQGVLSLEGLDLSLECSHRPCYGLALLGRGCARPGAGNLKEGPHSLRLK